ncbi:ADC synthase, partial [Ceratobasidium sp. AG-I]
MLGSFFTDTPCPLTTLLYDPEEDGFYLLSRHFARLQSVIDNFFPGAPNTLNIEEFTNALWECVHILGSDVRQRVRVVVSPELKYQVTATSLPKTTTDILSLRLDPLPTNVPLPAAQKSTSRHLYDAARIRVGANYASTNCSETPFDVLMWNTRAEITETSIANFAVYLRGSELRAAAPSRSWSIEELERGTFVTPRADQGLIPGVMRAKLLEDGEIVEGTITKEAVLQYAKYPDSYRMISFNAVRKVFDVRLFPSTIKNSVHSPTSPCVRTSDTMTSKVSESDRTVTPHPVSRLLPPINTLSVTPSDTPDTTPGLTPVSSPSPRPSTSSSFSTHGRSIELPVPTPFSVDAEVRAPFPWRRGVIIDCYDSYTNNLLQLFDQDDVTFGQDFDSTLAAHVTVLRADQISWIDFESQVLPYLDFVILSPGPGSPHIPSDIGVGGNLLLAMAPERLASHPIPVLGVCLGHQALAALFGGRVIPAAELVHGRTVPVQHNGTGLFEGLPAGQFLKMVRYNSLTVDASALPAELELIAVNPDDNEIMGLKHVSLPLYGVQFHPESVCSRRSSNGFDAGKQILHNFMNIVDAFWVECGRPERLPLPESVRQLGVLDLAMGEHSSMASIRQPRDNGMPAMPFRVARYDIGSFIPAFAQNRPDLLFEATSYSPISSFFWLDSAAAAPGDSFARFSYMGPTSLDNCISYDLATDKISCGKGSERTLDKGDTFWHWMDRVQSDLARQTDTGTGSEGLQCGFVGYFGYEMKLGALPGYTSIPSSDEQTHAPDAQFMFADRLLAYDHWNKSWIALGLVRCNGSPHADTLLEQELGLSAGISEDEFSSWVETVKRQVRSVQDATPTTLATPDNDPLPLHFSYDSTPETYKSAIKACQSHIAEGNSYEICLTGQYTASAGETPLNHLAVYKHFRTQNPASHAAFVSFPATKTTIMSCSPELFIRFDGANGRQAIMKPIKGTLRRSKCRCGGLCKLPACGARKAECDAARFKKDEERIQAFVNDPKETAENLMIADLIRANLLEFCSASSVDVTKLFALETYENVYSLVSTITGTIPPSVGPVEGIRRCFPPGSMTGAPKLRSVQLLDTLETSPRRGIYSGCLGFLSLDDRAVFSVVIRTLVAHGDQLGYGAGGAITWLSDVDGEWGEVVLKAQSVLK